MACGYTPAYTPDRCFIACLMLTLWITLHNRPGSLIALITGWLFVALCGLGQIAIKRQKKKRSDYRHREIFKTD